MKDFWKQVFKNIAISLTTWLVLAVILIIVLGSLFKAQPRIKPSSILVINLSCNITDTPSSRDTETLLQNTFGVDVADSLYLLEVVDAIKQAATDERIVGLFLQGSLVSADYGSGFPVLYEISQAIATFKAQKKPVFAYLVNPTLRDYFLASGADTVFLNPFGSVSFNGLASELMFFGTALKKYGIGVQTTKVGKYKTAVDVFTRDRMSEEDRLQLDALLRDLWGEVLAKIARDRNSDVETLQSIADTQGLLSAQEALSAGLIDTTAYLDEVIQRLEQLAGRDPEIESFTQVALTDYITALDTFKASDSSDPSVPALAVVYAEGEIVDGESDTAFIGGNHLARELRHLREDNTVKAVILRINSPGGSALAAEKIAREIELLQKQKTTVVSMGTIAASGGYWIAAAADKIFAEPHTITGSIGIWGLFFNLQTIANTHGITWDKVKTATFADIGTLSRPKTGAELALFEKHTRFIYETFLQKVSTGRQLALEDVETIAQGRIWSGIKAHEIGLVDQLGGIEDAIAYAVQQAGLGDDWNLIQVPEPKPLAKVLSELLGQEPDAPPVTSTDRFSAKLIRLKYTLERLKRFNDPHGIYARLPFDLRLQ